VGGDYELSGKNIRLAKNLRKRATDAEQLLWRHLRARQMEGLKFRRQQPIGDYIVDFVCFERRIVIELDGGQHATKTREDTERDEWLRAQGFRVCRFWNSEVLKNIDGILEVIGRSCCFHPPLSFPSRQGRGGKVGPHRVNDYGLGS